MKYLFLGAIAVASVRATADKSSEDNGNWYCSPVQRISYKSVGTEGSYDRVVDMDAATGQCQFEKQLFSGPLAPLDEDLSLHFRGPLILQNFGVYKPYWRPLVEGRENVKRKTGKRPVYHHRHHHHAFAASDTEQQLAKRQVSETVTVAASTVTVVVQPSDCMDQVAPAPNSDSSWVVEDDGSVTYIPPSTPEEAEYWALEGWYVDNVTAQSKDGDQQSGVVWLNNMGKNGLTYASADGTSVSDGYEVFNGELGSQQEIALFSFRTCEDPQELGFDGCGFVREGAAPFVGFGGAEKAFFFEFSMPDDGGFEGFNVNMPAIWALNAKIPRTEQYGPCSCWQSGCGEFDIFETLAPGDVRGKSTFHKRHAGGSSDYFVCPVDGFITLAVIMSQDSITVEQLSRPFDFPNYISADEIAAIHDDELVEDGKAHAIYDLSA